MLKAREASSFLLLQALYLKPFADEIAELRIMRVVDGSQNISRDSRHGSSSVSIFSFDKIEPILLHSSVLRRRGNRIEEFLYQKKI